MKREFETNEQNTRHDTFNVLRAPAGREGSPINHLDSNQLKKILSKYYGKQEKRRQRYLARIERKGGV